MHIEDVIEQCSVLSFPSLFLCIITIPLHPVSMYYDIRFDIILGVVSSS